MELLRRVSRLELLAAALAALVLAGLAIVEPDILEAPFENGRTLAFTFGGSAVIAIAFLAMLRLRVPPAVRLLVVAVPFIGVSWWLLSPFFIDEEVDDEFATSIAAASETSSTTGAPEPTGDAGADPAPGATAPTSAAPSGPRLLGAGSIVGLAGHDGTGDAGFFAADDGSIILRLENLDIDNGPDLRLYVVAGAGQTTPTDTSLYLGRLRGNVGNQTYPLPDEVALSPGEWTVLVWCEAFDVEFVAATVSVA